MNELILDMYIKAVQTKRLNVDMIPVIYREEVEKQINEAQK